MKAKEIKTNEIKTNEVNNTLQFPLAEDFERDLTERLIAAEGIEIVSVAMMDLDKFLKVNEKFGHAVGDEVLIQTGLYLKRSIPEGARIYRYAGDCFTIIFAGGTEKEEAFLAMEEIRRNFTVKTPDGSNQSITIGIAASPEDGTQMNELLRKTDSAMYRGKIAGSNRVCLAREEKMVTKTSHYTAEQLQRLTKLSKREGIGEAILLREALDTLLRKYDV